MKKIKLLMPAMVGLSALPCLSAGFATSCSQSSIEIKKNDNVTITADTLKVGEALVINYELKDGYGFDIINSSIKFGNGVTVYLIQCTFDETNKKIYVPSIYVKNSNVVIDIKAEANTVLTVTKDEYIAAWNNIKTASAARKATLNAYDFTYDTNGEQAFYHKVAVLNGNKTHTTKYSVNNDGKDETKVDELWSDKDEKVGYWNYEWMRSEDKVIKYCMTLDAAGASLLSDYRKFGGDDGFDLLVKDELLNCYWNILTIGKSVYEVYIKFNANKEITGFGYESFRNDKGNYKINTDYINVEYSAEPINIPEAELDPDFYHEIDENTRSTEINYINGRYEFIAPSVNETTSNLQVVFSSGLQGITQDTISIYVEGKGILSHGNKEWFINGGIIEIQKNYISEGKHVYITVGYPNDLYQKKQTVSIKYR